MEKDFFYKDEKYSNEDTNENSFTLPVIHEEVIIQKNIVDTGKVTIKKIISNHEEVVKIPVVHEEIDIIKIPVNKIVDTAPEAIRYDGDTMIISVLKEVPVISIMLVEEIHITKRKITAINEQPVSLRQEEVIIERTGDAHLQSL